MITVKTAELTGAQLDWAVAVIEGLEPVLYDDDSVWNPYSFGTRKEYVGAAEGMPYSPSTGWGQGGPIIEREQIVYRHHASGLYEACVMTGKIGVDRKRGRTQFGETILIAAMRAFVASKLGSTVEVPA